VRASFGDSEPAKHRAGCRGQPVRVGGSSAHVEDANGNYELTALCASPRDGECGVFDNQSFGQPTATTRYADSFIRGSPSGRT